MMTMTRRRVFWMFAAVALASCTSSLAKAPDEVTIELSSVTLGDDCAPVPAPKPAPPATKVAQAPAPAKTPATPSVVAPSDSPAARCAGPNCGRGRCDQTSMQLAIVTQAGMKPTTFKITKVELLDEKGKLLETLTSRDPSQWKDAKYVTWDQTLAANQTLKASYALTAPSWDKLTNGRWNAHSRTFQLRVTMTVGSGTRTVEKQAITAARLPPAVPT